MKKRLLAALLSLCMVMTLLPGAFAATMPETVATAPPSGQDGMAGGVQGEEPMPDGREDAEQDAQQQPDAQGDAQQDARQPDGQEGDAAQENGPQTDAQDGAVLDTEPETLDAENGGGDGADSVAAAGEENADALQAQIDAAESGAKIVLAKDETLTQPLAVNKNLTLDLNGQTLTNASANVIEVTKNGDLTIVDSTASAAPVVSENLEVTYQAGAIKASGAGHNAVLVAQGGKFTLESGRLESDGNVAVGTLGNQKTDDTSRVESATQINGGYLVGAEGAATVQGRGATLVIDGGVLAATDNAVVAGNGEVKKRYDGDTSITINGGVMLGTIKTNGFIACGVYHPQKGTLNITGGTFHVTGGVGVLLRAGTAHITGGTIAASGTATGGVGDKKSDVGCYGVVYDVKPAIYPGFEKGDHAAISGAADITGEAGALYIQKAEGDEAHNDVLAVTGGTFSSDVTDYVSTGYECTQSASKFTVSVKNGMEADVSKSEDGTANAEVGGNFTGGESGEGDNVAAEDGKLAINVATNDQDVSAVSIAIRPEALTSVAEQAAVSAVEIQTDVGTLTVDRAAWRAMTANATEGDETKPLTLQVARVDADTEDKKPLTYTLTAKAGEDDVFAPDKASGSVTVAVSFTKAADASDPEVYYVGAAGAEKVDSTYTPGQGITPGTLVWTAKHFSDYAVSDGTFEAAATTSTGTTTYGTFREALAALLANGANGGTVTLLKDADLSNDPIYEEIGANVVVKGNGKTLTLRPFDDADHACAFMVWNGATLTLDAVRLTINAAAGVNTKGVGFDLLHGEDAADNTLRITNGSQVTLDGLYAGVRAAGEDAADSKRGVMIDGGSTLTVRNVGYATGGYMDVTVDHATVDVQTCGEFGVAADNLILKNGASLSVSGAAGEGVIADQKLAMDGGSSASVANCGTAENTDAVAVGNGGRNTLITGATALELASGASLAVTGGNTKVSVGNATTVDNQGTITGTMTYPEPAAGQCRIIFLVDGQTYAVQAISVSIDGKATFTAPASPSKSGYTFTGWNYGSEVSGNVLTLMDGRKQYTYTAQWSKNDAGDPPAPPSGGGSSSSSGGGSSSRTLTFVTNGGTAIQSVSKSSGTVIDLSDYKTTRAGYTFEGWYADSGLTERVDTIKLTKSAKVYAKWSRDGGAEPQGVAGFTDVPDTAWYADAVAYVTGKGMMNGNSATRFAPDDKLTRGMIAQVLYNLEGRPAASGAAFDDVTAAAWYADAVNWAASQSIVSGYGNNRFGPEDPITREQMAAILYRYAQVKGYDVSAKGDLSGFADSARVSGYASGAVQWAVGAGLLNGKGNGVLDPAGNATRAEVAQILMNFSENVAK